MVDVSIFQTHNLEKYIKVMNFFEDNMDGVSNSILYKKSKSKLWASFRVTACSPLNPNSIEGSWQQKTYKIRIYLTSWGTLGPINFTSQNQKALSFRKHKRYMVNLTSQQQKITSIWHLSCFVQKIKIWQPLVIACSTLCGPSRLDFYGEDAFFLHFFFVRKIDIWIVLWCSCSQV